MLDFIEESIVFNKNGTKMIYPDFVTYRSDGKPVEDIMVRGGDFYAIWNQEDNIWSTDRVTAKRLIDQQLNTYAKKYRDIGETVSVMYLRNARTKQVDEFNRYCSSRLSENFHQLDTKLTFANDNPKKKDYASMRLNYPLEKGSTESWDKILSVLYSPEEQMKIEWVIGCIVSGDSKKTQKFAVMYGNRGTGKSTILNIIEEMFTVQRDSDGRVLLGYCTTVNAGDIGSSAKSFALESVRDNPLVAIEHESKLSKIDDNTKLNALVSHESVLVNVKNKSQYVNKFNTFLILASNDPVKITDAKSGILRRLIDIVPTGNKIPRAEYDRLTEAVMFELGAIAYKCLSVYKKNKHYYDDYVPIRMMQKTNDFYVFMTDFYFQFEQNDPIPLRLAKDWYDQWCKEGDIQFKANRRVFGEELKNYFREFKERAMLSDGTRAWNVYSGFKKEMFESMPEKREEAVEEIPDWLKLNAQPSKLDILWKDRPAQYANEEGHPRMKWANVASKLGDIYTDKLHYVRPLPNEIVIDFDLTDESGNKSLERNLKAAVIFPPTYAETSKSGNGLHLHYLYTGDVSQLESLYSEGIEVKVFTGNASLRRKVTLCNSLDIAQIASGLPTKKKETKKVISYETFKTEESLIRMIERNLRKEIADNTKSSIDYIYKDLEKAYNSGLSYDVSHMISTISMFAAGSHNQAENCMKIVAKMKWKSKDREKQEDFEPEEFEEDAPIVFFDVEVFINLFILCFKLKGKENPVVRMINPKPVDLDRLRKYRLVGFNNRKYDNHILYAAMMGYTREQLYRLSQKIISGSKEGFFSNAYNMSYTDVYDFCAKKQSLKKWEFELDIAHKELAIPWDSEVPESRWEEVADYCCNDVMATEAVWEANQPDFIGREILADLAGMTVNDTTNTLTTRFIFGSNKNPQNEFNYRFMGIDENDDKTGQVPALECNWKYTRFIDDKPVFPGYIFEYDTTRKSYISTYRGEEIGEGGYVYAEPGMYHNVVTFDVASQHPHSIIAEQLFGERFTKRFEDIVKLRVAIKHKDFDKAKSMLGGAVAKYLNDEKSAKSLAYALKIAINSVYGLTAAKFDNAFRDSRNIDNIVAKRGALFMCNLRHEVQEKGFTVIHCKTDSIKVVNPTPELEKFISDYGRLYGYTFEIEDKYERICLVNDAVYIAKHEDGTWTATGKQFAVPYVYKTLFSHDDIVFKDICETFSVTSALYLDMNEGLPDVTIEEGQLKKAIKDGDEEKIDILSKEIEKGHTYVFVGRVGQFTPVKPGLGGGLLMRSNGDNYAYATGAKGYRWLESADVKRHSMGDISVAMASVDMSYYQTLADKAIETISKFGDFNLFVS